RTSHRDRRVTGWARWSTGARCGPAETLLAPAPTAGQKRRMEAGSAIRVFLLGDHDVVRRGLHDLLSSEPDMEIVGESGSAQEAARRIPALRPDVAVLDGRLPDGSGIEVCRDVRAVDPTIRALILTSYDDDEALFAAIM